jgi:hypothetical protein
MNIKVHNRHIFFFVILFLFSSCLENGSGSSVEGDSTQVQESTITTEGVGEGTIATNPIKSLITGSLSSESFTNSFEQGGLTLNLYDQDENIVSSASVSAESTDFSFEIDGSEHSTDASFTFAVSQDGESVANIVFGQGELVNLVAAVPLELFSENTLELGKIEYNANKTASIIEEVTGHAEYIQKIKDSHSSVIDPGLTGVPAYHTQNFFDEAENSCIISHTVPYQDFWMVPEADGNIEFSVTMTLPIASYDFSKIIIKDLKNGKIVTQRDQELTASIDGNTITFEIDLKHEKTHLVTFKEGFVYCTDSDGNEVASEIEKEIQFRALISELLDE